jgi:capsule polysaccharide export protein KpsE/RkpR
MLVKARNPHTEREIFVIDLDGTPLAGRYVTERVSGRASDAPIKTQKRRAWPWYILMLTPTLLAIIYAYGYANDRFQTEARFVIRSSGSGSADVANGLGLGLQQVGGGSAFDEGHIAKNFILSRDALLHLTEQMPMRSMLQPPTWDPLFQFPGLFSTFTHEGAFKH